MLTSESIPTMNNVHSSDSSVKTLDQMQIFLQLYDEELQKIEESQNRWTKLKEDYESLEHQLSVLPKDLTKDVMVSIGPRALMKGKIVHTNEILVRLGEDWFAKRSAAQASEICKRRLDLCKEKLDALEKTKQLLKSRRDLPLEEEAIKEKEIVEVCTEEELEQWRVEHQQKEKEYRKQLAELQNKERTNIDSEEALWKRLDELELQEELEDELNRLHGDDDEDDDDEDDDSDLSDNEETDENGTLVNASFGSNNIQGGNGLIRRKIVIQVSESTANKASDPGRRVSFPEHQPEENEGTSLQMSSPNSARRVSFAETAPEEISCILSEQTSDLQSASDQSLLSTVSKGIDDDPNQVKNIKSILKIKSSDPSTILNQELNSSAMDEEDEEEEDVEPITLPPPVTSEVLEHNPDGAEASESSVKRPMSRFRAARSNQR